MDGQTDVAFGAAAGVGAWARTEGEDNPLHLEVEQRAKNPDGARHTNASTDGDGQPIVRPQVHGGVQERCTRSPLADMTRWRLTVIRVDEASSSFQCCDCRLRHRDEDAQGERED